MSRPLKETYDLSDAEKRDLIALIQRGLPLPEKYRLILFEDQRKVGLAWNGKTRAPCTAVLPVQAPERMDKLRTATRRQEKRLDPRERQLRGWISRLILSSLKRGALRQQIEQAGALNPTCIDPGFDVGAGFSMDIEFDDETFHSEPNRPQRFACRDTCR